MERLTERELYDGKVCFTKCSNTECPDKCAYCEVPEKARQKLKEYEDLEEKGFLLRLPCKVGDTLYQPVYSSITKVGGIEEMKVLEVSDSRIWAGCDCFDHDDLGKTVFLAQSEAEEALRKMNETEEL